MSDNGVDQRLFSYIWKRTRREQTWILFVILASMPINFILLDLPKYIINGPIQGKGFEAEGAVQSYFKFVVGFPDWLVSGKHYEVFTGLDLSRMESLYALSGAFLALVILSGLFKFYINTYKGQLGERMLQVLRFELFERVLNLPLTEFRRVKPAEVATMIKDEVEPLGGFIGDAFVQPVFLLGQIITAMVFIILQNFMLGMITFALVAVQGVVIPKLRVRQLELGRQRQLTARALAGHIGEIVEDLPNIIVNDTFAYQKWGIATQLNKIFVIRYALYRWKFFVKFLNNMIAQFTPFLFYTIGGYLAIRGTLDLGQLVAVIAAYRDLPGPVKELIDWDQERMDVEIKYNQVIEQFGMASSAPNSSVSQGHMLGNDEQKGFAADFSGKISIQNLGVTDGVGSRIIQNLSLSIGMEELVAIVGPNGSGADALVETLARLQLPTSGRIELAGRKLEEWPHSITGKYVSYVGPDTYFQQSSIEDALIYGLRHAQADSHSSKSYERTVGNSQTVFSLHPQFQEAGSEVEQAALQKQLYLATQTVDLADDIVSFSLNERLSGCSSQLDVSRLLEARKLLRSRLERDQRKIVETFDPKSYNSQATIAENLLFGMPESTEFQLPVLADNTVFRKILVKYGVEDVLFETGCEITRTLLELFDGVTSDDTLMRDMRLLNPAQFDEYRRILKRISKNGFRSANAADRSRMLQVAFSYVEPRDRLGMLDKTLEDKLLNVRHGFMETMGAEQQDIVFHDPEVFNPAASIQDNVLFGRVNVNAADAEIRVKEMITQVLQELDLHALMFATGLKFNIGNGGRRLNAAQRQKLALARAILRQPRLLVANRALSNLDSASQKQVLANLFRLARSERDTALMTNGADVSVQLRPFGIIWSLADPRFGPRFERIIKLDHGVLVEDMNTSPEATNKVDDGKAPGKNERMGPDPNASGPVL